MRGHSADVGGCTLEQVELAALVIGAAITAVVALLVSRQLVEKLATLERRIEPSKGKCKAVSSMSKLWLRLGDEDPCRDLLFENMWVLEPEYRLQGHRFFKNEALSTIFSALGIKYPDQGYKRWFLLKRLDSKHNPLQWRPDVCGFVTKSASISYPHTATTQKVFLIIEFKKPETELTVRDMDQAYSYANLFRRLQENEVRWDHPIECLVVGGAMGDGVSDIYSRWGANASTITVRPITYRALLERARCLLNLTSDETLTIEPAANENNPTVPIISADVHQMRNTATVRGLPSGD